MNGWTILDYAYYYYHERGWHIMPKLKGEKHTYLQYVKVFIKGQRRFEWFFLERRFKYQADIIDGIVLKTGYVENGSSVMALDYDPRNDAKGKGKELIDTILTADDEVLSVESGGAGIHILCEYDPKWKNGLIPGTGIEVKNGALLVLPPSMHKSGNLYKFRGRVCHTMTSY